MGRRGDELQEHILWTAKTVFLETGFERASMDVIASRAQTSKRSVYAHFSSKERLFLAVIELVRGLFLAELKSPRDYATKPLEALTLFCQRYLEILTFESSVQMMRVTMAESGRLQEQAAAYYNVLFSQVHERLTAYLKAMYKMRTHASSEAAHRLLALILYPRLQRALFGLDPLAHSLRRDGDEASIDVKTIKNVVRDLIASLQ